MKWLLIVVAVLVVLLGGYRLYMGLLGNPRVVEEIRTNPDGARAARAMLLGFPDGRELPVNYLWEGNRVFAGADGRWWRAFTNGGAPVTLLIRGETLRGHAVVVLDDQAYVDDVFSRLRPTVPDWLPDWLNGKLVVITLDQSGPDAP
jgi:hypothetical protein